MPFQTNRRSVWLDAGIHAREWISTSTVLYTIARLINGTLARDVNIRKLIDAYDFYFMPVVNPDGYVYTHDDIKNTWDTEEQQEQQRMWRKNRRPHADCPGVDLNRNFPFAWDNRGASKFPWYNNNLIKKKKIIIFFLLNLVKKHIVVHIQNLNQKFDQ